MPSCPYSALQLLELRRECCNEYYVLAARALATLTSEFSVEEDLWYLGLVG